MSDIKQKAREYFEANLLDGDKITDCGKTQIVIDEDFIEIFDECIDLAIKEREEQMVEMIEKEMWEHTSKMFTENEDQSLALRKATLYKEVTQDIINLIKSKI